MGEMNINQVLQQLWNLKTVFFALGIGVIVYVLRLVVEKIFPSLKKKSKVTDKEGTHVVYANKFSEWWNDIILYVFPIALGVVIGAFAEKTFWPEFAPTRLGGAFYGAIVGWASGFIYKIAKKFLAIGAGAETDMAEPKKDADPAEPAEEKPAEEKPAEEKPAEEKSEAKTK